jgi:hypothetical protein
MTSEAGRQGRRAYPNIPESNWWALRRRFQQTMPREVDASYLATVLHISEAAAGNLTGPLRTVGLIDDDGRPTDRAQAWREDDQYQQVTTDILEAVYPQGLRDAAPPPNPDRVAVVRWFSRTTGAGQAFTERIARFYLLLSAGNPAGADQPTRERAPQPGQPAAPARPTRRTRATGRAAAPGRGTAQPAPQEQPPTQAPAPRQAQQPSVHIDIQVHIDPAATAEQIDQIFASMARHLYDRG